VRAEAQENGGEKSKRNEIVRCQSPLGNNYSETLKPYFHSPVNSLPSTLQGTLYLYLDTHVQTKVGALGRYFKK